MSVDEQSRHLGAVANENSLPRRASEQTRDVWCHSGIDQSVLLFNCLGNIALAESLLEEFEISGCGHIRSMMMDSQSNRLAEVGGHAHSLRSSAAIMGAARLSEIATSIESLARSNDQYQLSNQLVELSEEMRNCLEQISTLRHVMGD